MKTNVLITKDHYPGMEYPWHYFVQGPLGNAAPAIDYGHMETKERAMEMAYIVVNDAEALTLAALMDKYGVHWTVPDD